MHIFEQVAAELNAQGFARFPGFSFRKTVPTGGQIGRTTLTVQMDDTGRWLERVNGWGKVEKDVDLRDFASDPKGAIAAVLA